MNLQDSRYTDFGLCRDMLATPDIVRNFDTTRMTDVAQAIRDVRLLMLTGEGSSRIFPAKSSIAQSLKKGWPLTLQTEAGRQCQDYDLDDWIVFALSNSGRTAEVIRLYRKLVEKGHPYRYSLTAHANSMLESLAIKGYVLQCGAEQAVAATKSVIEQALSLWALLELVAEHHSLAAQLPLLADAIQQALTLDIPPDLTARIASARNIYWAGRNDGVAEELTLKTNEITRKPADFLEGTYAVHGVEEVMTADDVVIWIDPFGFYEPKFQEVLVQGVGLTVIAISSRQTSFPTIMIPEMDDLNPFVQMAAGWNVLVETGLALNINLDKPERARKVGNDFSGS